MAVNQNHTENRRGVIVPFGESVLKQCPDVMLTFPKAPEGYDLFRGSKTGVLFLTSYRVIFVTSHTVSDPMLSFMMPFELMRDCTVEQPVFHPNFIKGTITAAPDGGWEGQATFKLSFRKGGAIEFFQLMTQAAAAASRGVPFGNTSFWFGGPAMYVVVTRDRAMAFTPENPCQAIVYSSAPRRAPPTEHGASSSGYDVPPPGYGTLPSGYQAPPLGYQAPPPGYQAPPPGYQAPPPGYQVPPPGYQVPPPEYQALPPGYQVPPPGYQAPPPGYQAPPPGYQVPPPGHEAPPPGYQVPPPGHEAPPPGYRNTPPEDGAQPSRQETSLSSSSFQSSSPPPPRM